MSLNKTLLQQITERLNKPSKPKVPRNQWQHPGEVTSIPSRFITMKGVSYPVLGVGADGTAELMQPGMDYAFPQGPVVEYPMMQYGGQNIPRIQLNRATSESTAIPRGMDPRYQAALTNDMKRVEFEKARSKQPFLGSGRPINAEETKRRNKIYAKNQGLGYNEATGRVYDPVSPQASKTMSAAYENIVEPAMTVMLDMEGLGALGTTKPLVNAGVFNKLGDRTNMFIQRTLRNLKPGYVARKKELIDRGNQWTRDWFNHPISQQRYNDWVENPFLDMNTDEALRTLYNPDGVVTSDIPLLQGTVARNNMANFMESGVATVGTKNRKDFESSNVLGRYHHGRNDALVDVLHPDLRHTANTAVHENIHYLTKGTDGLTKNARKFLQKPFDIDPATNLPVKSNLETSGVNVVYDKYLTEPTEVHARIAELRRSFGLKPDQEVDIKTLNRIIEQGLQGNTSVDRRFFELVNNKRALKWLFNNAPAVAAPVAGVTMMQEKANGGMIFDKGGSYKGYSVVDYLNSVGLDSSKAARKQLAQELGIQNYDYSAGKNLELLDALQNGTDAPAPKTLAKGVVDLMIPRAYFDPRVGQPNMKLQQISSTGGRPTTLAPGVVDIIVPKYKTAPKVGNKKMSLRSISTTGGRPAPVVEEPNEFIEGVSELYNDSVDYLSGLASGIKRKYEQMQDEDVSSIVKKPVAPVDPTKYGYQQLYAVPDVGGARGDSLVAFTNTFDNRQGGRYYVGNKVKEVTDAGARRRFENTHGVGHFLRDSDILPGQKITPESWNTVKGYTFHTTSPGKTVSAGRFNDPNWYRMLYRRDPNDQDPNAYVVRYMRNEDVNKTQDQLKKEGWNLDYTVSGQHRFSDLDWDGEGPGTGYASKSKWVPLKNSNKYAYIPYKNKDGFSRFSGGSGVYIFKDPKTNKEIGVDVAGSVNTLRQVGEDLVKTHGIKPEDLTFVYHDMGSYSAKPKAKDGVLDYSQWINFNNYNKGFSGAPLMIRRKNGGQHGGLDRWFAEKWVDVKTGEECGRQEGDDRSYPACRPSKRINDDTPKTASELSSAERQKFIRSKTSSERINYQHRRKEYGGELNDSDMANKPNNPSLWSKAKSLAKEKYDVYPSAYANGWAAKWYKDNGGTWRKAEYGMEIPIMNIGGKPFPKKVVNKATTPPKTNPYKEVMSGKADFFRNILPVPDNVAQLLAKQIFGDTRMSTESLEDKQKILLWDVIQNAKKRTGKNNSGTEYEDYGEIGYGSSDDFANWFKRGKLGVDDLVMKSLNNPGFKLASTIGRGRYWTDEKDPDTVYYTDVYDWNPNEKNFKGNNQYQNFRNYVRSTEDKNLNKDKNEKHRMNFKLNKKEIEKLRSSVELADELSLGMGLFESGGQPQNKGFKALPEYVQAKILANMGYGGITYPFMQQGGEPDGAMALGQIDAAMDKLMNLRKFIQPDSDLEPWVSSKLTLLDHYTDAVSDYMQYNPEAQGEMDMMEMSQGGGIPQRYKNMGFTKTGVKKKSNRPGKKWMVLAKKGDDYKVVHGGYKGMQDYTQHGSDQRRKNFWNRMGGKNSSKATDPFSPLYWHKRFGTWESGGEIPEMKGGGSTWSGNTWYQDGGGTLKIPRQEDYPDYESWAAAMDTYNADNYAYIKAAMEEEAAIQQQMRQDLDADASGVKSRMTAIKTPPVGRSIDYKGPSIVDLLSQQGKTSDYASRKQLANQLGIQNYRGTADQNTEMIRKILDSPQIIDDYPSMKSVKSVARVESRPTSTSNQSPTKNKQNSNRVVQPVSTDSGMSSIDTGKAIFPIVDTPLRSIIDTSAMIRAASTNGNTKTVSNTPKQLPNKKSWWTQQWGQTADEFIANDPYFFAEESDPDWIKYADAPFTYLRNLGARTAIDLDPTAIAELLVSRYGATMGSALLGKMAPVLEKMGVSAANNVRLYNALRNPKIIQSNISLPKQVYVGPTGPTIPANAFPLQPGIHFEEGGMYINPANKGKFTTSAKRAGMGVQEFASHVLANREDYSPTQVKRANFARNASKWKKQEGGPMVGDEMDVTPEQLEMLRQMGYEFELI